MSYLPPSPIDNERVKAVEQEAEAKAERYAQQHPEGAEPASSPGLVSRMIRRARTLIGRQSES
jgi:hypothetical protein